jgi:hypothetical protein
VKQLWAIVILITVPTKSTASPCLSNLSVSSLCQSVLEGGDRMVRREISRDELFAMVWERPSEEVAKEIGISGVALDKLCVRLQVPKPPRGYWARAAVRTAPTPPAASSALIAVDFAWSARHLYGPYSRIFLDAVLCVSPRSKLVHRGRLPSPDGDMPTVPRGISPTSVVVAICWRTKRCRLLLVDRRSICCVPAGMPSAKVAKRRRP